MKFSEESSNGQQYKKKETLGNFKEADGRKYISRGFLPLIGKHMYQLAALSVDSKIIRKYQWTWTSFSLEITTSQSQAYSSFFLLLLLLFEIIVRSWWFGDITQIYFVFILFFLFLLLLLEVSRGKIFLSTSLAGQPEIVALPSIGFKVAAWLWTTGYSSADNSSLPTGNLGKFCKGTEYSFLELSINVQQSTAGIETLFHYWRHTRNVRLTDVSWVLNVK